MTNSGRRAWHEQSAARDDIQQLPDNFSRVHTVWVAGEQAFAAEIDDEESDEEDDQ